MHLDPSPSKFKQQLDFFIQILFTSFRIRRRPKHGPTVLYVQVNTLIQHLNNRFSILAIKQVIDGKINMKCLVLLPYYESWMANWNRLFNSVAMLQVVVGKHKRFLFQLATSDTPFY